MDETPTSAMLDVVRSFAADLATFRGEEAKARETLIQEVTAQMTAVRHDVYGSILHLNQQGVQTLATIEQQRKDSEAWRIAERTARVAGQSGYRIIVALALILSTAALVVSLSVAAFVIAKVF
jgi:hypothetical protein